MAVLHCVITKEFTFRGKPERFGNGYTLQTTSPLDTAFVKSVCDALVAMERARTHSVVKFPYRVGGPIGQDAVYTEEVASPPAGLQTFTGSWHPEMCVLAKSRIGPKRYAFKYYHGWMPVTNPGGDQLAGGFQTSRPSCSSSRTAPCLAPRPTAARTGSCSPHRSCSTRTSATTS
jgi:hypothetical protein